MNDEDTLLTFFKALADANRLRIVGLLSRRPHAVEELAAVLELRPSTVSHHLARLASAGLVRSTTQGHYHLYSLDLDALQERARALLSPAELEQLGNVDGDALDPYDRKTLAAFLDDEGRLKALPMKRKKFQAVLRHALRRFEDPGPWTEAEVNARLESLSDDTASLRRGFIDHGMMTRDRAGAEYRRT